jgi:hypothetical protein
MRIPRVIYTKVTSTIRNMYYKKQEDTYYEVMCNMKDNYRNAKHDWHYCFDYTLRRWKFNKKARKDLFENFLMENWKSLWKENTEFKDYTKEKMIQYFQGECHYTCDRMSLDRLFRVHWLYLNTFAEDIRKEWYKDNNLTYTPPE